VGPVLVKPKITPAEYEELVRQEQAQMQFKPDEEEPIPPHDDPNLPGKAFSVITKHEGYKAAPYKDSNKKKWTIGIGTLIGSGSDADLKKSPYYNKTIDEATAKSLAEKAITEKMKLIKGLVGQDKFNEFSPELQAHLVSGAYRGDITGSPKAIKYLQNQEFEKAAKEYLDNEEYRKSKAKGTGVYKRMDEAAAVIKSEKPKTFQTVFEDRYKQAFNQK